MSEVVMDGVRSEAVMRAVVVAGPAAVEGAMNAQRVEAPYVPYDPARQAMQRAMGATVTGVEK